MSRMKPRGWRLGGRDAPAWLQAPCADDVKKTTHADFTLLRDAMRLDRLAKDHPFRRLWDTDGDQRALSEARFEMHHLAHDLRTVEGVRGADELVRTLINDPEGYADFRYELRMAGAVGRSPGQKLLSLGGTRKGPDIEVQTRSNHKVGIACYRARSTTPALLDVGRVARELAQRLGDIVASAPYGDDVRVLMALNFERFPIQPEVADRAVDAFREVWLRPTGQHQASREGVAVRRETVRKSTIPTTWEVRLVFRMPVPARERYRLKTHVEQKLAKEQDHWASAYDGVPVFFMEESDFCLGISEEELALHLQPEASHSFQGILATLQFFADGTVRGRHRMEQMDWHARPPGTGLDIGIETFGQNLNSYAEKGKHFLLQFNPSHAEEEWLLVRGTPPEGVAGLPVRPLTMQRHLRRVPLRPDGSAPSAAELEPVVSDFMQRVNEGRAK